MSQILNLDDVGGVLQNQSARLSVLEKGLGNLAQRVERENHTLLKTIAMVNSKLDRLLPTAAGEPGTGSTTTPTCGHIGSAVRLDECPVGLVWWGDTLVLKTEYGTNEGRIDAYIVSSGEMFWGPPPQTIESQRVCMVIPVDTDFVEKVLAPTCGSTGDGSGTVRELDDCVDALGVMAMGDRMKVFARFCTHCGSTDPDCRCWNDE